MTTLEIVKIAVYFLLILAVTKPAGLYMRRVFSREKTFLDSVLRPVERLIYRFSGVDETKEHDWMQYTIAMLAFSAVGLLLTYAIQRFQHLLPLNPDKMPAVPPDLAWNTAVSFTTNTNWQAYSGESTMSHLTQMVGLTFHNFISLLAAIVLLSQGVIENFHPTVQAATLEGKTQKIPQGPIASQEAIKELGTNGGGFFNANSAHPYENPTPFTNLLEMFLIFALSGGLTYTLGSMTGKTRHGWAVFWAMATVFLIGALVATWAEQRGNPIHQRLGVAAADGNMEGKDVRFGIGDSALFATITTDASCGAINSWHDSFTPLGGSIPLVNIMLGEIIFGGVGAGMYGMLLFVVLAVFIAGLMVGRTPEYLGKKIEAKDVKLAMLAMLILTFCILVGSAAAAVTKAGTSSLNNNGPHGLSEMVYAFTSATGNNGSAFAGLNANTKFYNIVLGVAMFFGRFLMIIPLMGIAGSLAAKKKLADTAGTFPVDGPLFTFLLISVILIVGALTYFPVLSLGPYVEHFLMNAGKVF